METSPGSEVIAGTPLIDTIHMVFDEVTSVSSLNDQVDISIFPNPVSEVVNIQSVNEIDHVTIFNNSGQKLFTEIVNSNNHQLYVKNLPSGLYILLINTSLGSISENLILH